MDRRSLRKFNFYLSSRQERRSPENIVNGQMGARDRNTGRYQTTLDNSGIIQARYIGLSNSRPQGYRTEIDKDGWADS